VAAAQREDRRHAVRAQHRRDPFAAVHCSAFRGCRVAAPSPHGEKRSNGVGMVKGAEVRRRESRRRNLAAGPPKATAA
jgi:hypothetical protein